MPGGLGLLARSKIAKERKESAGPAVAKLLASGMGEVDAGALAAVATEYGAPAHGHTQPPSSPVGNTRARLLRLLGAATPPRAAWWRWVPRPPACRPRGRDGLAMATAACLAPNPGVEKKAFKAQP